MSKAKSSGATKPTGTVKSVAITKKSGASKSNSTIKKAQPLAQSTDASGDGRIKVRMIQSMLLIWLDQNIDENNDECRNTIAQLRRVVNTINTFTDDEQCVQFLRTLSKEKACLIISSAFGPHIVPRLHDMSQVDSIFIYCDSGEQHEKWTKEWSKIKGVFNKIKPICEALKQTAQQCEQNAVSISIMDTNDDVSNKNLDQLDPSFMYTQIMKEIMLSIHFEAHHIEEFLQYCRELLADNESQLEAVDQLARKYHDKTPIWWYTYECFLYPMLNRALRTMDADLIIKLGFFISDLHRQIEQLHTDQFNDKKSKEKFTVYRGQGMAKEDFEKMVATKGGLLSFNCFLSTSRDRRVSLDFAQRAATSSDMIGVLFVMAIDLNRSTTPFASIADVGCYGAQEDEILFSMHTVFTIGDIKIMRDDQRLFQVELILTSDNNNDLRQLTNRIREEIPSHVEGWYRLGLLLWKMGQFDKAQQLYEILLEQETEEGAKAPIYHQLGTIKQALGDYSGTIEYYEKCIQIEERRTPLEHQNLAASYNNIGVVYGSMGDYSKALASQEKALAIKQKSLPPNHPDLALSYNNIGNVYDSMGDYPKALSSYEKAIAIQQQSLPSNHPDLASSFNNIAGVYDSMENYTMALSFYEKALAIQQKSLPPNHPDLARCHSGMGNVYHSMGNYSQALSSHEKALAIQQQSLSPNHPDLAGSHNNIGMVYDSLGDYSKALRSYEIALAMRQQSLPPAHLDLASSFNNIANVYNSMKDYRKALSAYERALDIAEQSLPSDHPHLQNYRSEISDLKTKF